MRIEPEGSFATDLWVPLKARPLNMDASRVSFSRKRGLLKVSWPCPDALPTKAGQALAKLDAFKAALKSIEEEVRAPEQNLRGVSSPSIMRMVRDELAQVEARLNKLQCAGIDSIALCDLGSDKDAAKLMRKELIQDAEHLQQRIEFMFDRIKDAQRQPAAGASSPDEKHLVHDQTLQHAQAHMCAEYEEDVARNKQNDVSQKEQQLSKCEEDMARQQAAENKNDARAVQAQKPVEGKEQDEEEEEEEDAKEEEEDNEKEASKQEHEAKKQADEENKEAQQREETVTQAETLAVAEDEDGGEEEEENRKNMHRTRTCVEGVPMEAQTMQEDDVQVQKPVDVKEARMEQGETENQPEKKEEAQREEERHAQEFQQQAVVMAADEWKARGNEAVKAGDYASAFESYSAGLAAEPDHAILLSNRALCSRKLGRLEEALIDAERCTTLRPDFIKGFCRGAMVLRDLRRPCEALNLLRKAPHNDEVEKLSAEVRPEAEAAEALRIASLSGAEKRKEEGNAFFKKGLIDQALSAYDEALDLCSDLTGELSLTIRNNRANCHHQLSNYEAVIAETSFVLEHQPNNLKALIRRMVALEPLEKYERALEDARHVLRHAPGNEVANRLQHRLGKLVRDKHREQNGGA